MRKTHYILNILTSALFCAGFLASCATDGFVEDPAREKAHALTMRAYEEAYQYSGPYPDWERVRELATRAIKADPQYPLSYSIRGAAYNAMGKPVHALHDLDRALELSPDLSSAFVNRGISYMKLKLYDLAQLDFEAALELEPENITSLVNISQIFAMENDTYLACSILDKAVVMGLNDLAPLSADPAFKPLVDSGCLESLEKKIMGH